MPHAGSRPFTAWVTDWILQNHDKPSGNFLATWIYLMKTKLCLLFLALAVTLTRAQTNDLTSLLQQGLMEEQANRNLDAAITDYQALATQFDRNRQIAATAIFRLGECYRMQGKTNEAAAQYQRILNDFSDQQTLATMSREDLTGMGMAANGAGTGGLTEKLPNTQENTDVALWNKLKDLPKPEAEKILLVLDPDPNLVTLIQRRNETEAQLAVVEVDYSSTNVVVLRVKSELDVLDRQIDDRTEAMLAALKIRAQVAGADMVTGMTGSNDSTDPENQEIQRIQQMIQNSPDLINATAPGESDTPLTKAARNGWAKVANYLLAHGVDVNAYNSEALFSATRAGNRTMVELLLSHGANINAASDYTGSTPLQIAVENNFPAVVEVLLANKADVNAQDRSGKPPLYLAMQRGDPKIVSLLLDQKADVNLADGTGSTPLFAAVTEKHPEIVKSLLAAGAQINVQDDSGRTPLSYAAENDSPDILKMLLAAKADPNGGMFGPPLLAAILKHNTTAAEFLLEAGADPNAATKINLAECSDLGLINHRSHLTPLWLAVSQGQFPMVQLLLKFKADPDDLQMDENSLVFEAFSDTNILQALLDAGAKVDWSKNSSNWTPLFGAIDGNHTDAVKILLKHGANPHVQYFSNGNTPLHLAARELADTNIFLALLDYQADPNVRNLYGATALDILKTSTDKTLAAQLADLLRQHGALDKVPDWNTIAMSRPAANFSEQIFGKGTNDGNQFTLLEMLVEFYGPSHMHPGLALSPEAQALELEQTFAERQEQQKHQEQREGMAFPDLMHITIVRPQPDSTNETRIEVNLLNNTNGIDCAKDVPLQFGDVVEIPEYNHPLAIAPIGITDAQFTIMESFLVGKVELITPDQKVELPFHFYAGGSLIGWVLSDTGAQKVLESSSNLSRVKITRRDSTTGKTLSWILDCSNSDKAPPFRVEDGDVIEVPQKPQ
jgi:uncharacterized protein